MLIYCGAAYAIQRWPVVPRISLILLTMTPASPSAFSNPLKSLAASAFMARRVALRYSFIGDGWIDGLPLPLQAGSQLVYQPPTLPRCLHQTEVCFHAI